MPHLDQERTDLTQLKTIPVCLQYIHKAKTSYILLECDCYFKFPVTVHGFWCKMVYAILFCVQIKSFCKLNERTCAHKCPCLYRIMELHEKNPKTRLDPRENMPVKTYIEIYMFPENTLKKSRKVFAYFDFLPGLRVCYTSKSWTERSETLVNLDCFQQGRIWCLDSLGNVNLKLQSILRKLFFFFEV